MPREDAATKARRYLTEGRLTVTSVANGRVRAVTRGDGAIWHQRYSAGAWTCDCPVVTDQCAHLRAVRLVCVVDLERRR